MAIRTGTSGNDTLVGTIGDDTLRGIGGNDLLVVTPGNDLLDGGDGLDTADYRSAPNGVDIHLAFGRAGIFGYLDNDRLTRIEIVLATDFDDVLTGDAGHNQFVAFDGDDRINGREGLDTVWYANAPSAVFVDLGNQSASGGHGNDTLISIEEIRGSEFGDTLIGDDGYNVFFPDENGTAEAPNFGIGGNDSIDGRDGWDVVSYRNASGPVAASLEDGTVIDAQGNRDELINIEIISASDFNDTLIGGANDDSLAGF